MRIPAGANDGQRIKLKGKGNPGTHGGPPGDLFVDVHVSPDVRFDRRGRNVTTSVNVASDGRNARYDRRGTDAR